MSSSIVTNCVMFLGNPGERYAQTRHNLGWWVAERVAYTLHCRFKPGSGEYDIAQRRIRGRVVYLVKPQTYMNESGRILPGIFRSFNVEPESLLIVADDIALPLGRVRVRSGGSSGGHNGLASVIEMAGTDQIPRIRCGVGEPPEGIDAARFVLDDFTAEELPLALELAVLASEATVLTLEKGVSAAANVYNRKSPAPGQDDDTGAQ